jgi:hypothetical protein
LIFIYPGVKYIIPKFSILIIFTAIALIGMAMIPMLNLQLNPSRTLPSITVSFSWPGNEARVVEQEITSRLEAAFARVYGIKDINSTSRNGGGKITLTFHKGTPMDAARFEISMLVRQLWQEEFASWNTLFLKIQSAKLFLTQGGNIFCAKVINKQRLLTLLNYKTGWKICLLNKKYN